jgi:hypothetical protein
MIVNGTFDSPTGSWLHDPLARVVGTTYDRTNSNIVNICGFMGTGVTLYTPTGATSPLPFTHYQLSNDGVTWGTKTALPSPTNAAVSWDIGTGDGVKKVYRKFWSDAYPFGLIEEVTIELDTHTVPTGSVSITPYSTINGVGYQSSRSAAVVLAATDVMKRPVSSIRFNVDVAGWSAWEPYVKNKNITLSGADGLKTVQVQFKDALGLVSTTAQAQVVLDTTLPVIHMLQLANGSGVTSDRNLNFTVVADADTRFITITQDLTRWDNPTALILTQDGVVYAQTLLPQVDGTYKFYARATDRAGNVSAVVDQSIVLDITPPDTVITSSTPTVTNANTQTFTFTSTKAGSTFQVQLHFGAQWAPYGGYEVATSPYTTPPLADGLRSFKVRAVSPGGLVDPEPASVSWTVDTVTGAATISGVPNSPSNSDTASLTVGGVGVTHYKYRINGGGYSAETAVATLISLSSLSGGQAVDVVGKAGGVWQVVPTTASWTVVVRSFDGTETTLHTLSAEVYLPTQFDLYAKTASAGLSASAGLNVTALGGEIAAAAVSVLVADYTPAETYVANLATASQLSADMNALAAVFDVTISTAVTIDMNSVLFDCDIQSLHILVSEYAKGAVYAALLQTSSAVTTDFVAGKIADLQISTMSALSALFAPNTAFNAAMVTKASLVADFIAATVGGVAPGIAWVLNLHNNAISKYEGFAYNSFCDVGGVRLAAGMSGVDALDSLTDNGAAIPARVRLPITPDFNMASVVPALVLKGSSTGEMAVTVTVDGASAQVTQDMASLPFIHAERFKLSQGLRGRNWEFLAENVNGAGFSLEGVELENKSLPRRR